MTRPPDTASSEAAIFAVSAGLRNVELTTSKPRSGPGTAAAIADDKTKQSNAIEPRAAPLREDVLAGPEALEAEALAELRDLEDAGPCLRRLPAVELVEVALRDLEPDPDLVAGASAAGGHGSDPSAAASAAAVIGALPWVWRGSLARGPQPARGNSRPASRISSTSSYSASSELWSPGGGHDELVAAGVGPLLHLLDAAAELRHHLGVGECALVEAHHPLAVEVRLALVCDARIEAALQLDRVGVATHPLARLAEQREHRRELGRLDARG